MDFLISALPFVALETEARGRGKRPFKQPPPARASISIMSLSTCCRILFHLLLVLRRQGHTQRPPPSLFPWFSLHKYKLFFYPYSCFLHSPSWEIKETPPNVIWRKIRGEACVNHGTTLKVPKEEGEEEKRGEMRLLSFTSPFPFRGPLSTLRSLLFRRAAAAEGKRGKGKWSSKSWSYNEMKRLFVPGGPCARVGGRVRLFFFFLSPNASAAAARTCPPPPFPRPFLT